MDEYTPSSCPVLAMDVVEQRRRTAKAETRAAAGRHWCITTGRLTPLPTLTRGGAGLEHLHPELAHQKD